MSNKKVKKVNFSKELESTRLIPKYEIDMLSYLWWNDFDKYQASKLAFDEITTLLNRHPCMTYRQALKLLYQPNNISYNKCNFE
jgi:CRISPR/Cas system-associated protein Cas10 (large subunit of type III CRISPR-Cas system)